MVPIVVFIFKGISKLRTSSDGEPLPSARKIQVKLFLNKQIRIPDKNNQLLMQWGQFVAHDVSNLAIDTNGEGNIMQFYLIFNHIIR